MAELDPITLLVLGPMRPPTDGTASTDPRTIQLTELVRSIVQEIQNQLGHPGAIHVEGPDDNPVSDIIPGILRKIERADLVICDLSGGSQNVMYELGLIHALGLPYIVVTSDARRPFYVGTSFAISHFELASRYDGERQSHRQLLDRIRQFLAVQRGDAAMESGLEDFAANPVSAYFNGLPIVDISAPAGLAAGYWMNAVRRFVRHGGYFDPPPRPVTLALPEPAAPRPLSIRHFVAVQPIDGLNGAYGDDIAGLGRTLDSLGLRVIEGTIAKASDLDLRSFGAKFIGRVRPDGGAEVVEPGIVIEIPTTLYALQYSPRIMRIDEQSMSAARRAALERLRRRRYRDMLERFGRLMQYFLAREDSRGHTHQVHFVTLEELPGLLAGLMPPS